MTGSRYKVFLSHSKHDSWICERIGELIRGVGAETHYDAFDFEIGRDIGAEVKQGIRNSDELLILLSPASIESDWVRHEAGIADAYDLPITVVLLHVTLEDRPAPLAQLRAIEINDLQKYMDSLNRKTEHKHD